MRFRGGGAGPPIAAWLWHAYGADVPYFFAAASVLLAALVIAVFRRTLSRVDAREADAAEEGAAILIGDAA